MCGICGYYNLNGEPASQAVLRRMTNAIAHRGPDGEGNYTDRMAALGHRRLSILDLSDNGKQPMLSQGGNYVIVYNGELYNFKEIKNKLAAKGYVFQSQCDTEVVLNSYIEWGEHCLELFNGMFAFVIYDKVRREFFCARDRYGIKPFYYAVVNHTFLFGSEQKAVYEHPLFYHKLDLEAVAEYFTFQNILTDKTFEKDIKILEPGCFFHIGMDSPQIIIKRYWDFNFREDAEYSTEEEYAQALDDLLRQAVNRQLVSDTEIGSFLSGGMDSGTITCIASKSFPHMKTFTCGYDMSRAVGNELGFDERNKSEIMAHAFSTEHYEMILQPEDIERILPQVSYHNEEPRVGQSYTNYYISKLASKFVKVCFSGTGGDELFGGYPWRYYRGMNASDFDEFVDGYYQFWQRLIPTDVLHRAFSPVYQQIKDVDAKEIFKGVFKRHECEIKTPVDYINQSLYFEAKTFLYGMLMIEDKLTMAHGLESRVPLLDNDLVDFAMRMPVKYKLSNLQKTIRMNENNQGLKKQDYFLKTNDGKSILRKTMEKYIPKEIDRAAKQGFSAPDATWFRDESIGFVKNVIYDDRSRLWEYMDKNVVRSLVDEHLNGTANRRLLIWGLLNFNQLLKTWF
ncbi:MAG: asparagine synthase (glutamine-hydrolyzing) [Eubacterium sp.]|nr:asparagine synthase (glutamine-hydrolyzing) [Eubacterium sp.]